MPPTASVMARRSLENASVWSLVVTLVLAVLLVIPSAAFPFLPTKAFLLAVGALSTLALYILARLSRGALILPPITLVLALWLPALAYLLSATFSGVSFAGAFWGTALESDTLGFVLALATLGTLAALSVRRPEHYRLVLSASTALFIVLVALQVLILLVGQFVPGTISPSFSLVGSVQDLSVVLGLGVVGILLALRSLELRERLRLTLIVTGAFALALLAVLNSTLVWILVALVALGLFVEAVMKRRTAVSDVELIEMALLAAEEEGGETGARSLLTPLATLAIALFFLIGGTLGNALAQSLHVNVLSVSPSWQSTVAVARKTYAVSPLFGSGPGTFGSQWLQARGAALNATVFWNVDFSSGIGFIPTSFVTTGLMGAAAWLAFLALLVVLGLRLLIARAPEDPFIRSSAVLFFVSALLLFVVAIFALPGPVVLALAFLCAGLFASTMRYGAGGYQWGVVFAKSPRLGFVIVFALTLLLLASVAAAYALVERYVAASALSEANAGLASGNLDAAESAAQRAIAFAPTPAGYQALADIANGRLNQIVASTTLPAASAQQAFQSALSGGVNAALTATQLAPDDYRSWLLLGNLYAQAVPLKVPGAFDSAKTAYGKAAALAPTNPQIPYTLAQLDIANHSNPAAEADLKAAIALKQDYTPAIFLLSQLEVADGNVKDALAAAEAAAYFTPNNASILFQVGILRAASNDFPGAVQALSAAVAANPAFANAHYFLSAAYAKQKDYPDALTELKAVADLSPENARAVAPALSALANGKDPFPATLFAAPTAPIAQ